MATVIPVETLRRNPSSVLFEGREEVALSFFVTEFERGDGPGMHTHPYPEVFLVENGTAAFEVGDEQLVVGAGHVVVVPARTPHRFSGADDGRVRVLSMHPRGTPEQTEVGDGV
jgi:mannose-6-phosphate isomerase-like protein (cupin superfamily)